MTQKQCSDTLSRNSIPNMHRISTQQIVSAVADAQRSDDGSACSQTITSNTSDVIARLKFKGLRWTKYAGSTFNVGHFISLLVYGIFGLSSKDKDNNRVFLCMAVQ
ncbi:uncharacterized protein ZBAI_02989 [Zygosaccharomyces bailii ISA1307]|nr:uncharacterized protein ZBAI_02989 [Zygosaccharomyces bailii ISA1307]